MTTRLVPTPQELARRVPAAYWRYAGIGPYYLPIFGRVYRKRLRDCLEAVYRHVPNPGRILDAGCGLGLASGALADHYPAAEVMGLDLYPEDVLQYASRLLPGAKRVRFVSASIEATPFSDAQFAVVTAFDVLEHVPHPERALDEIRRVLVPGGVFVASVPIESPILRGLRYLALLGGRRGEIHPHWEGTYRGLSEFEAAWRARFMPREVFNTPLQIAPRLVNYDVVFVGQRPAPTQDTP